jgi:uncharacterized protein YndB with AHSA1/START domain
VYDPFAKLLDAHTIRLERDLPGPIERVWSYLTDPDMLETWLYRNQIPTAVGEEHLKTIRDDDGTIVFELRIRTRVYDPPHVLEYNWIEMTTEVGQIRDSVVRWELTEHGDRVHLTLTHSALPTDAYTSIGAGWHAHLDVLVARLTGNGPTDANARYEELAASYEETYRKLTAAADGGSSPAS